VEWLADETEKASLSKPDGGNEALFVWGKISAETDQVHRQYIVIPDLVKQQIAAITIQQ
jgi:hypothetical protein